MIRSMTAFGNARSETELGSLTIEFRTVNSRFLDINFRLPEDLRMAEGAVREELGRIVKRGKVDIRINYSRSEKPLAKTLDPERLDIMSEQLRQARLAIPDVPAPTLIELLNGSSGSDDGAALDAEAWTAMCVDAARQALAELQAAREREGARLAEMMLACSRDMSAIVDRVEHELPAILAEHQERVTQKLRDALQAVSPDGYAHISGAELSARIAQEASLFGLRIDVAEELSRLRSHIDELRHLLGDGQTGTQSKKSSAGSVGKRLDFLCQEMNREANTLGSKAGALNVTRAAIDLKLLIEQLREQAQNIE
ncbi:MAG: YicC family protein [Alcaligenaceae bacterium]|nr:YicC family protein [Alcaligenaceae bacterium]